MMTKADKMFEKLGYHKADRLYAKCTYWTLWGSYEDKDDLTEIIKKEGKLPILFIDFQSILDNSISIKLEECKAYIDNGNIMIKQVGEAKKIPKLGLDLEPSLIRAINEKCKELEWE